MARIFGQLLARYRNYFNRIQFAVLAKDENDENLKAFQSEIHSRFR